MSRHGVTTCAGEPQIKKPQQNTLLLPNIQFLCVLSKDAERLGDELSLQRMKSLSESQRALELERKLFTTERLLKQVRGSAVLCSSVLVFSP